MTFNRQETFTKVYKTNYWKGDESRSGRGSSLAATEGVRNNLPILIKELNVKTIFDAPCGDFHWMQFVDRTGIDYVGADIVQEMIDKLNDKYGDDHTKFVCMDIVDSVYPKVDLMIARDFLFHLPKKDILEVFDNFVDSGSSYILASMNPHNGINEDLEDWGWRMLDLRKAPYNFPTPLMSFDDTAPNEPAKMMCLWSREQFL